MTIGDRIRNLREERDMTQTDLAKLIKSTKQTIYKYENNIITNIPYDKIIALSDAFNVSPAQIMGWEEEAKVADILVQVKDDVYLVEIGKSMKEMREEQKKRLLSYAKFLSNEEKQEDN